MPHIPYMVHIEPQAEHLASLAHDSVQTHFKNLPDELQRMVRGFTAASFVVDDNDHSYSGIKDLDLVPVIVRYEFRRRLLQESGPEIMVQFTRFIDPEFKTKRRWKDNAENVQASVEKNVYRKEKYMPFSELKVVKDGRWSKFYLVRRVVDRTENARYEVEGTPSWCRFPTDRVAEVRDKMERVFGMTLGEETVKSLFG